MDTKEYLKFYESGCSDYEAAKIMNTSRYKISSLRNKLGLEPNKRCVYEKYKDEIISMYNKHLFDEEISKTLGISRTAVCNCRKKYGLKPLTKTCSSNNDTVIKQLLLSNGYTEEDFYRLNSRKDNPVVRDEDIPVIIGILMGDGSMQISSRSKYPCFYTGHGTKQALYTVSIAQRLLCSYAKLGYTTRHSVDERTGLIYETFWVRIGSCETFDMIYKSFYINGKKIIPIDLLNKYYNGESLAYHFMDDGSKVNKTISIATNCFERENIQDFVKFLENKFGLYFTIRKNNTIYLRQECMGRFVEIVGPYIHKDMLYKLQSL